MKPPGIPGRFIVLHSGDPVQLLDCVWTDPRFGVLHLRDGAFGHDVNTTISTGRRLHRSDVAPIGHPFGGRGLCVRPLSDGPWLGLAARTAGSCGDCRPGGARRLQRSASRCAGRPIALLCGRTQRGRGRQSERYERGTYHPPAAIPGRFGRFPPSAIVGTLTAVHRCPRHQQRDDRHQQPNEPCTHRRRGAY